MLRKRTELERKLYDRVREKVTDYARTDEYRAALIKDISSADTAGGEIFLSPADMPLADKIRTDCPVKPDSGIKLGGWYVLYADSGIIEDHTFDMRFADATGSSAVR